MHLFLIKLFILAFLVLQTFTGTAQNNKSNLVLVVHGGAGTILKSNIDSSKERAYRLKLEEALISGYGILEKGGTSIDAVEAAIRILEDSPLFNAGKGSVFTNDGKNEMDASIMDGKNLKAGAVAGVRHLKNPISAAKAVMEKSPHVMLIGEGAEIFARKCSLEFADTLYFFDQERWDQFQKIHKSEQQILDHQMDSTGGSISTSSESKFGTVGAVALDRNGNLAAGTSTGGMTNKKYGRVGDSPIIGAGTYANNKTCAVSSTGHGEYFIRLVLAYDISALMEYKSYSLAKATQEVIMGKLTKLGGFGGVIALDAKGNISITFNTEGMFRGYIKNDGRPHVHVYKEN